MKIIGRCENDLCRKIGLMIRTRSYKSNVGRMRSQSRLCRKCYKGVKKLIKSMNESKKE